MKPFKRRLLKTICIYLIINFFAEWLFPVAAYALTSGPAQPEFSSFEPVATTSMVNDFTGDFTYNLPVINVPGPNGSGYAASLSYHSGVSSEEEASWVGYGWTLNPGAINRGKQGFPDDYNGDSLYHTNQVLNNSTVSVGTYAGLEVYSIDAPVSLISASLSAALRYNNYKGFSLEAGVSLASYDGLSSLSYSVSGETGHSFDAAVNPAAIMGAQKKKKNDTSSKKGLAKENQKTNQESAGKTVERTNSKNKEANSNKNLKSGSIGTGASVLANAASQYGMHALADEYRPTSVSAYTAISTNVSFNVGADPMEFHVGPKLGITGSYTEQTAMSSYTNNVYGYMYLSNTEGATASTRQMDYAAEKESMYNKRDLYLSIPQSAPDMFNVSGEGLGGAFRFYNRNVGHLYPPSVSCTTNIINVGDEATLGTNLEPATGFNVGAGSHTLTVQNWANTGNTGSYDYTLDSTGQQDEPLFFRFNGDVGGNVAYTSSDAAYQASVVNLVSVPGAMEYKPVINSSSIPTHFSSRSGRSSYIGYHTNSDMMQNQANAGDTIYYKSYTKPDGSNSDAWSMVSKSNRTGVLEDRIGEIATVNEEGNLYVYGLPVYTANETSMSYSGEGSNVLNNYLAYENIAPGISHNTQVGETWKSSYASVYLLTQITTSDYIDRTFNGPSQDDFGGWTKFSYKQAWGNTDKTKTSNWYNWRFPYQGLFYDRNELCDPRDDLASYSTGQKEIYYLKSIETKTHIAYFITNLTDTTITDVNGNLVRLHGSGFVRKDGLDAYAGGITEAQDSSYRGSRHLQMLEKIVLYAKSNSGQISGLPLKVVHFEYYQDGSDYSTSQVLCRNLPNADASSAYLYSNGKRAGKLTLRRVWFEYEGISNSRISPYEFTYCYKPSTDYKTPDITTTYSSIINYGNGLTQNPDYSVFGLDNWGNYAYNGPARYDQMRHWVFQGKITDTTFDAAAWHLKTIRLPSGGEILVQYEQDDYAYVQDQMALGMVSLINPTNSEISSMDESNSASNKYYLNLNDVDIDLNNDNTIENSELNAFATKINTYINQNKKLYFKFLYELVGTNTPDLNDCGVDFITGYMNATATADSSANHGVYITLSGNDAYRLPRDVCKDYITRTKAGLNLNDSCDQPRDGFSVTGGAASLVQGLFNLISTDFTAGSNNCLTISLPNSYIRVPLLKAKKGGGVRVKRILMYDGGIENGDESLFGTEYFYLNSDGSSSGVATNEPATTREENALINYMIARAPQTMAERVISGKDKDNFEGPLGESLLPAPSVGYSRIIASNIHTGKSGTGFKISEFYTAKDYPFTAGTNITPLDDHAHDYMLVPAIWVNVSVDNRWLSQGYSFVINSMHGQPKRTALYGGNYNVGESENNYYKSYEQIHTYYNPGEQVPVMNEQGIISMQYMGRENDLSIEMKSVDDIQNDGNFQVDFDLGVLFIPLPGFSLFPYLSYTEKRLRTHVINKVTHYAPIEKSVTTTQDGIVHITENKVFSKHTGKPIVIVETDGYDGLTLQQSSGKQNGTYTNYTIPASYIYPNMMQKANNERYCYSQSSGSSLGGSGSTYLLTLSSAAPVNNGFFTTGDLVRLSDGTNMGLFYISGFASSNTVLQLQPLSFLAPSSSLGAITSVQVINSGYTNQLNESAGSILTYGTNYTSNPNPPSPFYVSSGSYIQNNSSTLGYVLSGSAKVYTDSWTDSLHFIGNDYGTATNPNDFETGRRGKWREQASYVFKNNVLDAITGNDRVYTNAGAATSYTGFNYTNLGADTTTKWLRTNRVDYYTPNGNAVEESNILNIKSAAKFGYNESVPVMVAKNAPYTSIQFISFEDISGSGITSAYAHSGSMSYQLNPSQTFNRDTVIIDYYDDGGNKITRINSSGFSCRFWLKTTLTSTDNIIYTLQCTAVNSSGIPTYGQLQNIARVGDWTLYEAQFQNVNHSFNTTITVQLNNSGTQTVWLDDIRIQPLEAQVNCYIYDKSNLRLITSFDDQHFGLYYQYNAEGKLVRKLVETEEGMKTITETQYNVPSKPAQ